MASAKAIERIDWIITLRRRPGVTSDGDRGAIADKTHRDRGAECGEADMYTAVHRCCPFHVRQPCAAALGVFVLTDQQCEDGGQQHEDHRLHEAHQQLHEVERIGSSQPRPGTSVAMRSSMFSPAKMLP